MVPTLIDMSVGVAAGGMGVGTMSVGVDETGVKVVGEDAAVGKTSIEKEQALRNSALNTKTIIDSNHLHCFIAFSLFSVVNVMGSQRSSPNGIYCLYFQTGNGYKTFARKFLFPCRNNKARSDYRY